MIKSDARNLLNSAFAFITVYHIMGKKSTDVAVSLSMVIRMPSSGINQGAQALLSYKYGSKNYDRVMQIANTLLRFQFLFFAPMTTLLELFPEVFLRIFTTDPAVIKEATTFILTISKFYGKSWRAFAIC